MFFTNQRLPQPEEILDVVRIAPAEPYEKIQQGRYNYLTDAVFHEAGHLEHRRLEDWQKGHKLVKDFPSEGQREKFITEIRKTKKFPAWALEFVVENAWGASIHEMYAMLIDREAAKRLDLAKYDQDSRRFEKTLKDCHNCSDDASREKIMRKLNNVHDVGHLLVLILEERFENFDERKKFVREVLKP